MSAGREHGQGPLRRPVSALHLYRGSEYITSLSSLAVREWHGGDFLSLQADNGVPQQLEGVRRGRSASAARPHPFSGSTNDTAAEGVFVACNQSRPGSALTYSSRCGSHLTPLLLYRGASECETRETSESSFKVMARVLHPVYPIECSFPDRPAVDMHDVVCQAARCPVCNLLILIVSLIVSWSWVYLQGTGQAPCVRRLWWADAHRFLISACHAYGQHVQNICQQLFASPSHQHAACKHAYDAGMHTAGTCMHMLKTHMAFTGNCYGLCLVCGKCGPAIRWSRAGVHACMHARRPLVAAG